jgi:hypothetical protein
MIDGRQIMACEWCGQKVLFTFPVLSRNTGFIDDLDEVCSACAELVNEEYYCGTFRNLVPFDVLSVERVGDLCMSSLLVL